MKALLPLLALFISINTLAAVRPKKIIGTDERARVQDLFSTPYNRIGQIGDFCTGSLIAPNIVITAAHCIADIYNPYFNFGLSKDGSETPYGSITWQKAVIPSGYRDGLEPGLDFAFLFLNAPVEGEYGMFKLNTRFDPSIPITIAGYPQDKKNQMWESSCLAAGDDTRLYYPCDTLGGMSGAPIFQKVAEDRYNLIGIHTRGEEGQNTGVLLRETMTKYLEMAKKSFAGSDVFHAIHIVSNPYLDQEPADYTKVELFNNCREKIIVTTLTKDIRGNLKKGLRLISPGKSKIADTSYSNKFYYTVRSRSGNYTLYGREKCGQGASWPNCFVSTGVDLELDKNTIDIDCN